jgi:hypothetical protein
MFIRDYPEVGSPKEVQAMPTLPEFLADFQGSRFRNEYGTWPVDFEALLRQFDEPAWIEKMVAASRLKRPALAGVVANIEGRADVDAFMKSKDAHETRRFRQAVGVGIRIAMERLGWQTSGKKGSLGRRVPVPVRTTTPGASGNDPPEPSVWFSKAEIYRPPSDRSVPSDDHGPSGSQIRPGAVSAGKTPEERAKILRACFDQLEQIGSPDEREETYEILMKALAETRRLEGRSL